MVLELVISESRSEIPRQFGNVVLETDGEDHFDRFCEKEIRILKS